MPANDIQLSGFKELEADLLALAKGEESDKIQRKALRAAANVMRPAMVAATPVRTDDFDGKGTSLPPGTLKGNVRAHVSVPKDGQAASAIVDFGKYSYVANFVDGGHVNPTATRGLKHTPGSGFVRKVEDATKDEAGAAYLATLQAEIDKAQDGK